MAGPLQEGRPQDGEAPDCCVMSCVCSSAFRVTGSDCLLLQVSTVGWLVAPLYRALLLLLSLLAPLLSWNKNRNKNKSEDGGTSSSSKLAPSDSLASSSPSPPFIGAADDSFSGVNCIWTQITVQCVW